MNNATLNPKERATVYIAASEFSLRENLFNEHLARRIEERGYSVILPQRDGFEFTGLQKALSSTLRKEDVQSALYSVIYLLDVGKLIPASQVVCANFDEPVDSGVVVEVCDAKAMGKYVLGIRTDVRRPYGELEGPFGGMHAFPAFKADVLIQHYSFAKSTADAQLETDELAGKIDRAIVDAKVLERREVFETTTNVKHLSRVIHLSGKLFHGIADIHSREGLGEIAARYMQNKMEINTIGPVRL